MAWSHNRKFLALLIGVLSALPPLTPVGTWVSPASASSTASMSARNVVVPNATNTATISMNYTGNPATGTFSFYLWTGDGGISFASPVTSISTQINMVANTFVECPGSKVWFKTNATYTGRCAIGVNSGAKDVYLMDVASSVSNISVEMRSGSVKFESAGPYPIRLEKVGGGEYFQYEFSMVTTGATSPIPQSPALSISSLSGNVGTPLSLQTSGGAGTGAVTFNNWGLSTSGTASGCTLSGSNLSATSGGTCIVIGIKAGDSNYDKAFTSRTAVTFIDKTPQSALSITSTTGTFSTSLPLATSGGSGDGALSYGVSNGTATGCNVSSGILSSTSAGTCLVTATKASDATYSAVSSPQTTITFAKASRTLSFTTSPTSISYGSTATVVATPSAAGGAVSYSSTGSTACTVNSSTGVVTATQSSGTCEITATVAEGTNYLSASVATPLVITTGTKSVTIAASDTTVNFGTSFTTNVLNTGSLGLVGSDSIESSGATFTYQGTGSTVYGPSTVKPVNAGTYSVTPSAAVLATGSASNYNFTYVSGTVSISKVARTLAFGGGGSATVNYGSTLTVAATPSAGDGAVTYSAGSSTGCSVNPSTGVVTATSATGTCAISASIEAGTNHLTANTTSSFAVTLAKKNITLKTADFEVTEGGDVEPATEVSVGSLVGSDTISSATFTYVGTGTTKYGPSSVAPSAIGTYEVTPSVPVFGTGSATNYTIAFAAGTLTINAKPPAPSSGAVAVQPVAGPAIAGVTARRSDNGKGSFLRVRLDKTPAAFEQLTVVVRLLNLEGELVEELRIPVSQGSAMLEIPIDRAMGQFNAVAQISSSNAPNPANNSATKLRPAPLQQSTIREATEERPARLLGKRLSRPVLFVAESAQLTPAIKRELRKAARVAKESGSRLAVTGFHTISGRGEAFEQSLAEKRALRVARYLRNQGLDGWILYDGLSGTEGQQFPGQPRRVEIRVLK